MSVELDLIPLALLTVAGFAATNLDNLVLLVALSGRADRNRVGAGFLLAAVTLLVIATLGVLLGDFLEPHQVGYLGLLPLGMGLYLAWQWFVDRTRHSRLPSAPVGVAGSYLLMVSNSGDSLAVFLPLMADTRKLMLFIVIATYAGMALLWTALARALVRHPLLAATLDRHGRWILPCIMVTVGCFVLLNTATDRLPG